MPTKSADKKLSEQIEAAITDHVMDREDRRGFSKLDALLGAIEAQGRGGRADLEKALLAIIPTFAERPPKAWEALRMIVAASRPRSSAIAESIIKMLDRFAAPKDPESRFQAFLSYREAGGALTRPRLDREENLRDRMRPQWADLVLSAYAGAPKNIVAFVEEQLSEASGKYSWRDVRKRLPLLFKLLGEDFSRGVVRITQAIPDKEGQDQFAIAVKGSFGIDTLLEVKHEPDEHLKVLRPPSRKRGKRTNIRQRYIDTFRDIVPRGLVAWKALSRSAEQDGA